MIYFVAIEFDRFLLSCGRDKGAGEGEGIRQSKDVVERNLVNWENYVERDYAE